MYLDILTVRLGLAGGPALKRVHLRGRAFLLESLMPFTARAVL